MISFVNPIKNRYSQSSTVGLPESSKVKVMDPVVRVSELHHSNLVDLSVMMSVEQVIEAMGFNSNPVAGSQKPTPKTL